MLRHTKVVNDSKQVDSFELELKVDDAVKEILDYWAIEQFDDCVVDLRSGVVRASYSTVHDIG